MLTCRTRQVEQFRRSVAALPQKHFRQGRAAGYKGQGWGIKDSIMAYRFVLILAAACLWLQPVRAGDLYSVDKLPVDAAGASPSEARDKALAAGRDRAFAIIFKRLTQQSMWGSIPQLPPQDLDDMVTGFTVDNERHSTTRYLADVSFNFSPARVRSAMQQSGLIFSETLAKPVVILPIRAGVGWSNDSQWAQSWKSVSERGSLRPVVVPLGDAAEIAMAGNVIPDAASWAQVAPLAEKYGSTEVWITSADPAPKGLSVSVVTLRSDARRASRYTIIANAGESEPQLLVRAAAMVRAAFEENWKSQTAVNYGSRNSLEAAVSFTGLPDWVSIRNELSEIRLIQRVNVNQMLTQGARLQLEFVGKIDQLRATLKQANLTLNENDTGLFILARDGADVSTLPPALLTPPAAPPQIADPTSAIPTTMHAKPSVEGEAPPIVAPAPLAAPPMAQ